MKIESLKGVPELKLDGSIHKPTTFDPNVPTIFRYEGKEHKDFPHIVKFSGGKTSGMLLFVLLKSGLLKAERGDVVVFNNTSAEHPATYEFVKKCKKIVEEKYKIPFFWVEFQTYEDARGGEYARIPSFRLVNSEPYSQTNPDGYRWRGEAFEEMLSFKGFVPTLFRRTCTKELKLQTTRMFLKEWLANKEATERLGHFGNESRIDIDEMYERHKRHNGSVPLEIYKEKKDFMLSNGLLHRQSQRWNKFSPAAVPFNNKSLEGKTVGRSAYFGEGGMEYIAFVGLRYDEMRRIIKVRQRNESEEENSGYEGEHVYMPFETMKVTTKDVEDFWQKQNWKLELKPEDNLSNCTYCFLKGLGGLKKAHVSLQNNFKHEYSNTPCDITWWEGIEKKYGRDMIAEKRTIKTKVADNFIGFFGTGSSFSYERLRTANDLNSLNGFAEEVLPCDCTD